MSLLERRFGAVVTAETESSLFFHQKIFFIRAVGKMAGPAALRGRDLVYHLFFVIFFLVALIAGFTPFLFEEATCLGRVRVVTGNAFPSLQHRMDIRFIHPQLVFGVAREADFVAIFLQQKLGHDPVPEVAIFTFAVLHAGVGGLHRQILIRKFLVAIQTISPGKPWPGLGGLYADSQYDPTEKNAQAKNRFTNVSLTEIHLFPRL